MASLLAPSSRWVAPLCFAASVVHSVQGGWVLGGFAGTCTSLCQETYAKQCAPEAMNVAGSSISKIKSVAQEVGVVCDTYNRTFSHPLMPAVCSDCHHEFDQEQSTCYLHMEGVEPISDCNFDPVEYEQFHVRAFCCCADNPAQWETECRFDYESGGPESERQATESREASIGFMTGLARAPSSVRGAALPGPLRSSATGAALVAAGLAAASVAAGFAWVSLARLRRERRSGASEDALVSPEEAE